ncbi:ferredoxin [Lacihabitans lacunae]|jgi:ferredoxin|uniref:Ferredoxin n=1 Tax=Lacihabitans lacunae TaxID=1028214 RepID=A0ABV7Z110_9BACT
MFRVFHYRNRCIGCNACVEIAFEQWRMSKKDGKAVLLGAKEKKGVYNISLPEAVLEENIQAMEACPVKVIKIER